ncbi:hypothetical protein CC1G_12423 [Coprinopsis cinerea okayama7|uniref:Uncharacterized protein n=1 Tax=Coprinopsis cinerea (strain Okayama-7 / 130 / ATCC MYA-4618 / FGSC 9003) TaxID=240176 RepID=A8P6G5_COPC7|nr:hypothetical protein CC1G_12423 [Coprinopsis cinerea okayama7\|eukprot:XP_001839151.2 hypothetical protein CC1G_12423 [Coprinopsis cinerea okayama7\
MKSHFSNRIRTTPNGLVITTDTRSAATLFKPLTKPAPLLQSLAVVLTRDAGIHPSVGLPLVYIPTKLSSAALHQSSECLISSTRIEGDELRFPTAKEIVEALSNLPSLTEIAIFAGHLIDFEEEIIRPHRKTTINVPHLTILELQASCDALVLILSHFRLPPSLKNVSLVCIDSDERAISAVYDAFEPSGLWSIVQLPLPKTGKKSALDLFPGNPLAPPISGKLLLLGCVSGISPLVNYYALALGVKIRLIFTPPELDWNPSSLIEAAASPWASRAIKSLMLLGSLPERAVHSVLHIRPFASLTHLAMVRGFDRLFEFFEEDQVTFEDWISDFGDSPDCTSSDSDSEIEYVMRSQDCDDEEGGIRNPNEANEGGKGSDNCSSRKSLNSGNTTSKSQASPPRQLLNSGTQKCSDGCNREPINQTGSASNSDGGMTHKPDTGAPLSKDDPESDEEYSGDAEDNDGDGDKCESRPKLDTATSSNTINEPHTGRANAQSTSTGLYTHIDHDDDEDYDEFDSDNSIITHEHMWLPNIRYLQIDVEPGSREAERVHEIRRYLEDLQRRRAAIERKFEFRINQPPFYAMYMGGSGGGSNVFL